MPNFFSQLLHSFYIHPGDNHVIIEENILGDFFKRSLQFISSLHNRPDANGRQHGDKISPYNGAGMDYSESRHYTQGDDIRAINWKQSARSDNLIINKYHFENETTDYLILDQRHGMFFGTRVQPKIAVAIKSAITAVIRSLLHQRSIRIIEISDHINTSVLIENYQSALVYFKEVARKQNSDNTIRQPEIGAALNYVRTRNPVSSAVYIISDFVDLKEDNITLLKLLEVENQLKIIKVNDPIENDLPLVVPVNYQSTAGDYSVTINSKSDAKVINNKLKSHLLQQEALLAQLTQPPCFVTNIITDDTILETQATR